ncbi:hypothetical protein [Enterococcus caccae]|uniref:TPR repeat-containing protein n=1 Tax=Enterococcus caccae ATCC BAA-1240 TaxID=1158612 RepID=R3TZS2_9ENTE|nr:hypothetical protein [Enterococcus caccae]EOL47104.1 hypothetical protein UC7_01201 [Enterococcus caccae ATCC BAA-1240]EOT65746.1 hypothetical protein I580_01504 [Enterococcus caccae ATCC BAA-1240]OJG24601.1 hypothetical protein RU98_GL001667 [Enterococcus caccae]
MFLLTNKIPFPKNYERFIKLGEEAAKQNNLMATVNYYEQAYAIRQDFPLNLVLVNTYLEIGENEQALSLASEMKEKYFTCLDYLELYIQILIQNHMFIQAHSIINERILMEQSGEMRKLVSLKKKIRHVELMYRQFEVSKIKELKEELNHLSAHNYYEQLAIVKKAGQLPQDEFIVIGKTILLDARVHNLVRSWILEELVSLHVKEEVEFLWRDNKKYTVIPASIGGPLDCAAYQRILLFLEKELINDDPILLVDVLEEIRLHFAILYPLADEIIEDPKLWAISYIISYNHSIAQKFQIDENHAEIEKIQKIQSKIRFELEAMVL